MKVVTFSSRSVHTLNKHFWHGHIYVSINRWHAGDLSHPFFCHITGKGKAISSLVTGGTTFDCDQIEPADWTDVTAIFELREVKHVPE